MFMAVACSSTGSAARGGRWRTPRGRPRSLLPGWEREVSLDGLSDVVAGCQAAVLRAGWVSWAGLAGFWCTGWQGRLRAQVPEPAPDPGGGEPSRPCGPLPGPAQIVGEGAGEPELGVAGDDEPGPAVGRLGSAELWCGPAQERARQGPLRQTPGDRRAGLRPDQGAAGARRFLRRGLRTCKAEWKLLCGTHNLLKLWRHTATPPATRPATA